MTRAVAALTELACALSGDSSTSLSTETLAVLRDYGLDRDDTTPAWLTDFLSALARRAWTREWVPFEVRGLEASDAFEFIRRLDQLLPVRFVDNEERWTLVADAIGHEGHVSFEGYLWLTKPIGTPEPGEHG